MKQEKDNFKEKIKKSIFEPFIGITIEIFVKKTT